MDREREETKEKSDFVYDRISRRLIQPFYSAIFSRGRAPGAPLRPPRRRRRRIGGATPFSFGRAAPALVGLSPFRMLACWHRVRWLTVITSSYMYWLVGITAVG